MRLARLHHASGGWSVGAVALVAGWAARTMPPGTRIVAVFPDGPFRYLGTVYDDAWCEQHGLLGGPPPQEPRTVRSYDECRATSWTRCTEVVDPLRRSPDVLVAR